MIKTEVNRNEINGLASSYRNYIHALGDMSDEELMHQFQIGTVEAFDIIVERFSGRLMSFLSRFVRDPQVCEDLLQETFVRVYRNRYSYQPVAKLSTWIFTIAGNLARSEFRRNKRWNMLSITPKSRDDDGEYDRPLESNLSSPDDYANGVFLDAYIQDALNSIPLNFRELIVLRDVQQLSYDEIAEITGLPMGTVKSRINRGRTKLQKLLKDVYAVNRSASHGELVEEW